MPKHIGSVHRPLHVTLDVYTASTLRCVARGRTCSVIFDCIMCEAWFKGAFLDSAINTTHTSALVNISYGLVLLVGPLRRATAAVVLPILLRYSLKRTTTITQ
jgi:hypothetical protein